MFHCVRYVQATSKHRFTEAIIPWSEAHPSNTKAKLPWEHIVLDAGRLV